MRGRNALLVLVIPALTAWLAASLPAAAGAQSAERVEVNTGAERIVVDGDQVRIESGGTVTEVSGDWRSAGTVYVTGDTERILVELGAGTVEDRIQLNLAGDILFDFDSAAIRPDAAAQLAKVAHVIRNRSVGEVHVIGHTDSVGADAYNQNLSRQRAVAVMSWLHRNEAIPAATMVGSGMGSLRPIAHNTHPDGSDDPAGRARNRRVEIQMATREGVAVGPEVVIGPGAVRVTDQGVSVGGGVIRVDESGVRVGGISVSGGGVSVESGGGTTVISGVGQPVGDEAPSVCATGETCSYNCIVGDCEMICQPGASCNFTCPGGNCPTVCEPGAVCNSICTGGDCRMICSPGAVCNFSCTGGDCLFECRQSADCRSLSCTGEGCVCRGAGC